LRLIQHLDFGDLADGQARQRRRTVPVFDDRPGRSSAGSTFPFSLIRLYSVVGEAVRPDQAGMA
jgi:hypothetical protein